MSRFGFYPDSSAVSLNNFLAQRQANARSGIFLAGVQPLENHKYTLGILRLDANAVVFYDELPSMACMAGTDVDLRWKVAAELDGVAYEILEQLPKLDWVDMDRRQGVGSDFSAGFFDACPQAQECLIQ